VPLKTPVSPPILLGPLKTGPESVRHLLNEKLELTRMANKSVPTAMRRATLLAIAVPLLGGCSQAYLTRMTYEVLRQQDCRHNELETFCSRGFAFEYQEYERLRQDYIRGQTDATLRRVSVNSGNAQP